MNGFKNLETLCEDRRLIKFGSHISDVIGKSCQEWQCGETVFINAPTGIGKTFFIRRHLYEWSIQQNVEIALVVNRRMLRQQQWDELRMYELEAGRYEVRLHLLTYQELETESKEAEQKRIILKRCRYIVCDECHYWLADALFNSKLHKSFKFLTGLYEQSTLIFMSATMERIRPLIENQIASLYDQRKEDYEDYKHRNCYYRDDGTEYDLGTYADNLATWDEWDEPWKRDEPVKPKARRYKFYRDISNNLNVRHFRTTDDLLPVIQSGTYDGKWLIFVSSKKEGKALQEKLVENGYNKRIVYVDADYDQHIKGNLSQEEAIAEIKNIRQNQRFNCNILISTSILDCGVNICDPGLKNMVLISDDEDSFKQMLGRKRFLSEDEKLNLFICCGKASKFSQRARKYKDLYWQLCEREEISIYDAHNELYSDPVTVQKKLSYYDFDGFIYHANMLTIEAVRIRCCYCNKVHEEMERDDTFFLREQLQWIGKEYTDEWRNSSSVSLTQSEIDNITNYLQSLYQSGGIFSREEFQNLSAEIIACAEKLRPSEFSGKTGSLKSVSKALLLQDKWAAFSIASFGDDMKYYEILHDKKAFLVVRHGVTEQDFSDFVAGKNGTQVELIFEYLFAEKIPVCLQDDFKALINFINSRLKNHPELGKKIIRSYNKKDQKFLSLMNRSGKK